MFLLMNMGTDYEMVLLRSKIEEISEPMEADNLQLQVIGSYRTRLSGPIRAGYQVLFKKGRVRSQFVEKGKGNVNKKK